MKKITLLFVALFLLAELSCPLKAQDTLQTQALQGFTPLIGHTWKLDNTHQTFEWGVGRQSVISKSYVIEDGTKTLNAEGMWFWHPGEQNIKGYFTAVNMPVSFFDYTTTFEEHKIVHELSAYTPSGMKQAFREIMEFSGEDSYEWRLLQKSKTGYTQIMSGTFIKQ